MAKDSKPLPGPTPSPSPAPATPEGERSDGASAELSRRHFVRRSGSWVAGTAAAVSGLSHGLARAEETPPVPRVLLGRTGEKVSLLGLGTALLGHRNGNKPDVKQVAGVCAAAIDRGINYVDTARIYGRAEEALRGVLKTRRDKTFLATKAWANTYEEAKKSFEESLRTLGVDHVDVLHIHDLGGKDVDRVLDEKNGAWKYLEQAKKAGKTRFIGITGHEHPKKYVRMLETGTVDVMMVVLNFVDQHIYGFESKVLPTARKHRTGVLAMKVYGGLRGGWEAYGRKDPVPSRLAEDLHEKSIAYARSLEGVHAMVIGVHSEEQLVDNIRRVASSRKLTAAEQKQLDELGRKLAPTWTARFGPVA